MQPTRAELQRRRQQSARDRPRHEREQRDRARNRRQQAQVSILVRQIVTTIDTSSAKAMAPVLPWELGSDLESVFESLFNNILRHNNLSRRVEVPFPGTSSHFRDPLSIFRQCIAQWF